MPETIDGQLSVPEICPATLDELLSESLAEAKKRGF